MNKFLLAVALCGFSRAATAQSSPNDQPQVDPEQNDFTTGTSILPRGHFQIESVFSNSRSGFDRQVRLGDTLVRVPVSENLEVRAMLPAYIYQGNLERTSGLDDADLGARLRLKSRGKADFALTFDSKLPTGSRRIAERRFQPEAILAANFTLSSHTQFSLNAGVGCPTVNGERFTQALGSAEVSFDATPKLNAFFEVYGLNRAEAGGPSKQFAAGGLIFRINSQTALYGNVGSRLGNHADGPERFYSLGLARLFR